MNQTTIRFNSGELAFNESGDAPEKIQVFKKGKFNYFGDIQIIDDEFYSSIIKNFNDKIRGVDLMVDIDHRMAEAAGWIKGLFIEGDGLFAKVEWTELGIDLIKKKLYRYVSADFSNNYQDAEKMIKYGPTLFGVATTNRPFLKGMKPLTMKEDNKMDQETKDKMDKIEKTMSDLCDKMEKMQKAYDDLEKSKGEPDKDDETRMADKKAIDNKIKEDAFNILLSDGHAVEAQRKAFMENDILLFTKNAMPINTKNTGDNSNNFEDITTAQQAQNKISEIALKMAQDLKITFSDAVKKALKENNKLAELIYK